MANINTAWLSKFRGGGSSWAGPWMREAISKDGRTGGRNGSPEEPGCGWRRGWGLAVQLATVKEAGGRRGKGVRGRQTKELKLPSVVIGGEGLPKKFKQSEISS